ncbi:hypothetical protein SBV1_370083 [Verrucomicrobia bacterium]|nr:hypothetical protein SBV1_370083 [Verrucomicrobiota bacterium]
MSFWKSHWWLEGFLQGKFLQADLPVPPWVIRNTPQSPYKETADYIILHVSLKQVASKIPGAKELVKRINASLDGIIAEIAQFPDPDAPGGSVINVPLPFLLGFHWPPGPPPGPLMVAGELNSYSKLIGGDKEIETIIARILEPTIGAAAGKESQV